jgi:predicted DNA-binding transcriptional regulator YafY
MDRTERFYKMEQLLRAHKVVTRRQFMDEVGVSLATFKRDLEYMRERLHAPIAFNSERGGYELLEVGGDGPRFALPGLWFNPSEIQALLTMDALLGDMQPGLLAPHVEPLRARLEMLLEKGDVQPAEVRRRVRMLPLGARRQPPGVFETIAAATLKRRKLSLHYRARSTGEATERVVSPQRLVHYRDNWYVDGWCHLRDGLRKFSVDAVVGAQMLDDKAKTVDMNAVEREFNSGYGVFAGEAVQWARLRFNPQRARWVALETWHPEQRGRMESDGSFVLDVPYADTRELLMDILKFGADVEVLGPESLRQVVANEVRRMAAVHGARTTADAGRT